MDNIFYQGDELKVVNDMDGEEHCEGGVREGDVVTMMDRSSEHRPFIIIRRENGRQVQLERQRFKLHRRKVIPTEADYSEDEVNLAKNLMLYYKEELDRQGATYTVWENADRAVRAIFLHMARQLIIAEGFVIGAKQE